MYIIEPKQDGSMVPGTQTLHERRAIQALKRIPEPSSSPEDPLNWPTARKHFLLGLLCCQSVTAAALNPILATNTFQLVDVYKTTFTKVAMLTGVSVSLQVFFLVLTSSVQCPGARNFGTTVRGLLQSVWQKARLHPRVSSPCGRKLLGRKRRYIHVISGCQDHSRNWHCTL